MTSNHQKVQKLANLKKRKTRENKNNLKNIFPPPKNNSILLVLLFLALLVVIVFIGLKFPHNNNNINNNNKINHPTITPTAPDNQSVIYENKLLGFRIKYPKSLNLKATEIDTKALYREYKNACSSGKLNGCGGIRYPDFQIDFKKDQNTLFEITVYQFSAENYGLGEKVRDNFTYSVNINNSELVNLTDTEKRAIESILDNIEFITPTKPLSCLWSPELGSGFDPITDAKYIKEHKNQLSMIHGVYFDNNSQKCKSITRYSWNNDTEGTAPPFKEISECLSVCKN